MSALGQQFRGAAVWLKTHPDAAGCCYALKKQANKLKAVSLFRRLFRPDGKGDFHYWWGCPPEDHLARLIALDLAALIADEEGA